MRIFVIAILVNYLVPFGQLTSPSDYGEASQKMLVDSSGSDIGRTASVTGSDIGRTASVTGSDIGRTASSVSGYNAAWETGSTAGNSQAYSFQNTPQQNMFSSAVSNAGSNLVQYTPVSTLNTFGVPSYQQGFSQQNNNYPTTQSFNSPNFMPLTTGLGFGNNFGSVPQFQQFGGYGSTGFNQNSLVVPNQFVQSMGGQQQQQVVGKTTSVASIDDIFPQGTNFALRNPEKATTKVYSLRITKKNNIVDYNEMTISPKNFATYSAFCDGLTDIYNQSMSTGVFTKKDKYSNLLESEIGSILWLRYWLNTKDASRFETNVPTLVSPSIANSSFLSLGSVSQLKKSAQQLLIELVNNKPGLAVQGGNVNVLETIFKTFVALFKNVNSGVSAESFGSGLSDVREDRRSLVAVLASMYFDMPEVYFGICNMLAQVDIFNDVEDVLKIKSKNLKITGRELILASQIYAPNKGSYLDSSELDAGNDNQASLLRRYSHADTVPKITDFLNKINEVKAYLMGGRLKFFANGTKSQSVNSLFISSNLSECIDLLDMVLEMEGMATAALGERVKQVQLGSGFQVLVSAEAKNLSVPNSSATIPPMSELLPFIRAECFLTLTWVLTHWVLVTITQKINKKIFNTTTFSEEQKASFEMLAKFCTKKNFFLLNMYSAEKSKKLGIRSDLFLSKELDVVITYCLNGFASAFQQDNPETRINAMNRFKEMIKSSPPNSIDGLWPEPIPLVFKQSKAKFIEVTKILMDHIEDNDILQAAILNRSSNIDVLQKFIEIVETMRAETWYNKVFNPKALLTVKKIDAKEISVKNLIKKLSQRGVNVSSSAQVVTVGPTISPMF